MGSLRDKDMEAKVIQNKEEYTAALIAIEKLMKSDPQLSTQESNRLELLAFLVEQYEDSRFSIPDPTPLEALRFRMEQKELEPRDLVPFIGSRSKVSEVLSGKRPLSLNMIRALHQGLGIPASILVKEYKDSVVPISEVTNDDAQIAIDWTEFPIKEMFQRGYFEGIPEAGQIDTKSKDFASQAKILMEAFAGPLGILPQAFAPVLLRRSLSTRAARNMNPKALGAWTIKVLRSAIEETSAVPFDRSVMSPDFLQAVAKLSWSEQGPLLAQEFLRKNGITLVIEPHLPRTHLDGAAIILWEEHPVIGITARHDRLDNFWFSLLHELAHIWLHFWDPAGNFVGGEFYDDFDTDTEDPREREADEAADEALIPHSVWEKDIVRLVPSPQAVERLASRLMIHPAIIAGRLRHEKRSYSILNNMIGQGDLRKLFPSTNWGGE